MSLKRLSPGGVLTRFKAAERVPVGETSAVGIRLLYVGKSPAKCGVPDIFRLLYGVISFVTG
jgi:hypothetical protein